MTAVEFLSYFRIWGPLGIIAGLSLWGNVHQYRNGRADSKAAAAAIKEQRDDADLALKAARDGGADSLARASATHHAQVTELTNRFVKLHEEGATENRELTQQVRALLEVVSRKRGRP